MKISYHSKIEFGNYVTIDGVEMRLFTGGGYLQAKVDDKYVPLHRYIMIKVLGRELGKKEVVHHIDENKRNNDPDNLRVMTMSEHATLHNNLKHRVWPPYPRSKKKRPCEECGKETIRSTNVDGLCTQCSSARFDRCTMCNRSRDELPPYSRINAYGVCYQCNSRKPPKRPCLSCGRETINDLYADGLCSHCACARFDRCVFCNRPREKLPKHSPINAHGLCPACIKYAAKHGAMQRPCKECRQETINDRCLGGLCPLCAFKKWGFCVICTKLEEKVLEKHIGSHELCHACPKFPG